MRFERTARERERERERERAAPLANHFALISRTRRARGAPILFARRRASPREPRARARARARSRGRVILVRGLPASAYDPRTLANRNGRSRYYAINVGIARNADINKGDRQRRYIFY